MVLLISYDLDHHARPAAYAAVEKAIKENAISLWLRADPEILYERVIRRDTRPLLFDGDAKQILEEMVDRRYPIYAEAALTVESNDDAHEATVERVLAALKKYIYD